MAGDLVDVDADLIEFVSGGDDGLVAARGRIRHLVAQCLLAHILGDAVEVAHIRMAANGGVFLGRDAQFNAPVAQQAVAVRAGLSIFLLDDFLHVGSFLVVFLVLVASGACLN